MYVPSSFSRLCACACLLSVGLLVLALQRRLHGEDPFRPNNLVAWCIVPFDSQKRTPAQRAEMLDRLGIHRLAYDYRAEHIASFDDELEQLAKHKIELTGWWFPTELNDEAKLILRVLEKHGVKTQLWVTGAGRETKTPEEQQARIESEAKRIRTIAQAAARQGCSVGLYNHGGWFGEPENQLAIIEHLKLDNVGIVYNMHHGHAHVARFKELLSKMLPHLMVINLNGMVPDGEAKGQKIVPLGAGSLDVELLKLIRDSGYDGPIGILNHTDHDAEARLRDNLDGLRWLLPQLDGKPAEKAPTYRTWQGAAKLALDGGKLLAAKPQYSRFPLSVECVAKLTSSESFNIMVANHTKASGAHWELFSQAGSGRLAVYLPGYEPNLITGQTSVCDGQSHRFSCVLEEQRGRLYVDGQLVGDQAITRAGTPGRDGQLAIGRLVEGGSQCTGEIDSVRIFGGVAEPNRLHDDVYAKSLQLIDTWQFQRPATSPLPFNEQVAPATVAKSTQPEYSEQELQSITAAALASGKAERGVAIYASARSACLTCHKIGSSGGSVGPDLSLIGKQRTPVQIAESLLWPNRQVEDKYKVFQALTGEGRIISGYKVSDTNQELVLRDPSTGNETRLPKVELDDVRAAPTLMPEGLAASMSREQQLDLIAFLIDLGQHQQLRSEIVQSVLEHAQPHEPASFVFDRAPLDPATRPDWQAHVNRDRLYDFYAKEALAFRGQPRFEPLLAEYPGIDGGQQGHWGNQNEAVWENDAWNSTELSSVQAGVFRADKLVVPRAVCVRLGDDDELSACFDPETLSFRAVWRNGFVKFSKIRHGFIHGLEAAGEFLDLPANSQCIQPNEKFRYHGFYRVGQRVVFDYTIGDTEYFDAAWSHNGQFVREVAPRDQHSLTPQLSGVAPQWPETLITNIRLGQSDERAYVIDTIDLPWTNPWNALIYCGDHDFLPDGSALVCTMQGDVWHVSGFSHEGTAEPLPTKAKWRRFAAGLHHALGLKVDKDGIFVLGRDQITRLHDTNQDGEADFYECFSNAYVTSAAGHDYICGLQRDAEGNFYTASGNQGLVRISRDGRHAEIIAAGFRNSDGLGVYPDGTVTVPCSEGEWTPASMICAVPPRRDRRIDASSNEDIGQVPFYGYRGSQYVKQPLARPELPLVYLPRGVDNSAGGQAYVDSERWGPLAGNMIHFSFGTGSHFLLLRDEVEGQLQGAVIPLPGQFASGAHRGRFSPFDGQLYVAGMAGWGSYTTDRGCFQRVRYTGKPVQIPVDFHLHENGIAIRFSSMLDQDFCQQAEQHFAQAWNYRYSSAYGSAEYSAQHYGMRGHDQLRVTSAHVLSDGQTLFLELPDLQRCNQLHVQVATSFQQRHDLFATCNALDKPLKDVPGIKDNPTKKILTAHPLDTDMLMAARRLPNPWRNILPTARPIRIEAGKNLSFSTRLLQAKAGEPVALTLVNPDVVPHNWALIRPGTLSVVGSEANKLVADPEAVIRQYVPQTSDVICYTDIAEPQEQTTIYFKAPAEKGRYPFLCTFPGHWMVMNGELVVE